MQDIGRPIPLRSGLTSLLQVEVGGGYLHMCCPCCLASFRPGHHEYLRGIALEPGQAYQFGRSHLSGSLVRTSAKSALVDTILILLDP